MNYCTKCESYYQKPGTCNCYAEARQDGRPWVYPTYPPLPYTTPTWPTWWGRYEITCDSDTTASVVFDHGGSTVTDRQDVPFTLTGNTLTNSDNDGRGLYIGDFE